jgi:hypothetical protein
VLKLSCFANPKLLCKKSHEKSKKNFTIFVYLIVYLIVVHILVQKKKKEATQSKSMAPSSSIQPVVSFSTNEIKRKMKASEQQK